MKGFVCFGLLLVTPAWGQAPVVQMRRFALSGEPAPGTAPGVVFAQFGTIPGIGQDFPPDLDDAGGLAFHAMLTGPGVTGPSFLDGNALGLWKSNGSGLELVARQDEPAPGTAPGVEFMGFPDPLVSAPPIAVAGSATFVGGLRGPGVDSTFFTNAAGIWSDASGAQNLLVRTGNQAPGLPAGFTFRGLGLPFVSTNDRIAFQALWRAPSDPPDHVVAEQEGFWSTSTGPLQPIVLAGDPAPGTASGVVFGKGTSTAIDGAFRSWDTREQLDLAFNGNLAGPGIGDFDDEGVWVESSGQLTLIAREGAPAPGAGTGVRFGISNGIDTFGEVVPLRRSASGASMFDARLSGPAIPFLRSLWVHRNGSLQLVARAGPAGQGNPPGDPAPGLPSGWTFATIARADIDAAGQVVLGATVTFQQSTSQQMQGLWRELGGALTRFAVAGDPAPDVGSGISFSGFGPFLSAGGDGHLAFLASLAGPGVDSSNDTALFLADEQGTQRLVVREGTAFDVGGGLRTIARTVAGRIGANGEFPFELEFTDGSSGLFSARLDTTLVDYCAGDGSAAPCPCNNSSAPGSGEGCANSTGRGARVTTAGSTGVGADDLRFDADGIPPLRTALLYCGLSPTAGGAGTPFGDGLRCATGSTQRLGTRLADASGAAAWGPGLVALGQWSAGDVRRLQVWYRDGSGPCLSGFNLSNAIAATFVP